jgi:hypothetical protein
MLKPLTFPVLLREISQKIHGFRTAVPNRGTARGPKGSAETFELLKNTHPLS